MRGKRALSFNYCGEHRRGNGRGKLGKSATFLGSGGVCVGAHARIPCFLLGKASDRRNFAGPARVRYSSVRKVVGPWLSITSTYALAELNQRLSRLQQSNDLSDAEEFVRLYQERVELLKKFDLRSVRADLSPA